MVFHRAILKSANCNNLVIDNASITRVNSAIYLGIIIDVNFNWIEHITCIKNKISKAIGIMYKARQYLNKSSLVNLYYSHVYPYLTYCIEVWGCAYPTHVCFHCPKKYSYHYIFTLSCSITTIIYVSGNLTIRKDILS